MMQGNDPYALFTISLQSHLPHRTVRALQGIGGNAGLWSLSIRREIASNGLRLERAANSSQGDTIVVTCHASPTPGVIRVRSSVLFS